MANAALGRGRTVSAGIVADLIRQNGGMVLTQEVLNWGCDHLIDCFSVLARRDAYPVPNAFKIMNPAFGLEMQLIAKTQSHYSTLFGAHQRRDIDPWERLFAKSRRRVKTLMPATVVRQVFLGDDRDYMVDTKDGTQSRMLISADENIAPGSPVWLHLPPEKCWALSL